MASRLLLVPAMGLGFCRDSLSVANTRWFQVHLDAKAPPQLSDRHLDMQLTLAGEQLLVGLWIAREADAGIFFEEAMHGSVNLVLVAAGLRLDGIGEDRLGKRHSVERDDGRLVGQYIAGVCILQFGDRAEIPCFQLGDVDLGLAL